MKSRVLIVPLIAIMLLMTSTMVFATTELDMNWDGAGGFTVGFDTGDADMNFGTGGNYISGSLYAKDGGETFGVNTFDTNVDAGVTDGWIRYTVDRHDSYYGYEKYGPVERSSYSFIDSTGTASLGLTVHSDYGKFWASGGDFVADGVYLTTHRVENGDDSFAYFGAIGDGTLDLHHERDRTIGGYTTAPIRFGEGLYSYSEKAYVTQTGSGSFTLGAEFENSFTMGDMTASGPVSYYQSISFSDGFSWSDYSFSGD